MIASLRGELFHKESDRMIVDVNGVGYEVSFSQNSHSRLPEIGDEVFIHIYTDVREDALNLYGFVDKEEKEMFLLLVKVSGVGPKLALNMLSGYPPAEIARAIVSEDIPALVKLPGVGKKTAERLCVELKDKMPFIPAAHDARIQSHFALDEEDQRIRDVISALVNLGYQSMAARKALETVQKQSDNRAFQTMALEELLRHALRAVA